MDLAPLCKYGDKCYRQNPQHQKQFRHPKRKCEDEHEKKAKIRKVEEEDEEEKLGATNKVYDDTTETISEEEKDLNESGDDEAENKTEEKTEFDPEDDIEPESPEDIKESLKSKYLAEFGEDFYEMWKFCQSEKPLKPEETFKSSLGLTLVGPFDILAGKHKGVNKNSRGKRPNYLLHWRYYYDPPEFTTVMNMNGDKAQFHIGYYRDDPDELPMFVASNSAKEDGKITYMAPDIFSCIKFFLEKKVKENGCSTVIKKESEGLLERMCAHAKTIDLKLEFKNKTVAARDKKVVCKTLHGAGIVVPVDENEVGYRPVPETPAHLRKMFKNIADSKTEAERDKHFEPLQEIITFIQFANDECDYGEGLELGLDLFSFGGEVFHATIMSLLPLAYQLLRRNEFAQIIEAHLKRRRHTADLSELD